MTGVQTCALPISWNDYVLNLMNFKTVLNPVGILRGLNTRAYETIYSGRLLLQHTVGKYERHQKMLSSTPNVIFFESFKDLKDKLQQHEFVSFPEKSFNDNNLFARMKLLGVHIK